MRGRQFPLVFKFTFLVLVTANAFAAPGDRYIVSDVDDTVKVTHVASTLDAVRRGLFSKLEFAGMSTLYRAIVEQNGKLPTRFVSGSPKQIEGIVSDFIQENQFPQPWTLALRTLPEDTAEFKIRRISAILEKAPEDSRAILIGDDGERDPEIYAILRDRYPRKIDRIYIHRVKGRALPAGEIGYDTAADVALWELAAGRLRPYQLGNVALAVMSESREDKDSLFLPEYCPRLTSARLTDQLGPKLEPNAEQALHLARDAEGLIRQECEKSLLEAAD